MIPILKNIIHAVHVLYINSYTNIKVTLTPYKNSFLLVASFWVWTRIQSTILSFMFTFEKKDIKSQESQTNTGDYKPTKHAASCL